MKKETKEQLVLPLIEQGVLNIVGKSIVLAKLSLDIPFRLRLKLRAQAEEPNPKALHS